LIMNHLVIVESPAKAKTIQKFLGKEYKVMSSFGHIRDLSDKGLGIDFAHNYAPQYVVDDEKKKLVAELKKEAKKADIVWLASDEDREGEAISWHLFEVLGLTEEKSRRIVFHEITKAAILNAIEHPRKIDVKLVDAQQARRVLDRIVGYELSPVLWRKIRPQLSAGRVQSVAVRLIVEREHEIRNFKSEASYRVVGEFVTGSGKSFKAELSRRLKTKEEALELLEMCKTASFRIERIQDKPVRKSPAAPFTTSTLQQEAARKLGFPVSLTMRIAQRLYESGRITYMRTDSVNLSSLALNTTKDEIGKEFGLEYSKVRQFHTTSKGAQEAHEAIRPTYVSEREIEGSTQEQRLYSLIWKRTVASQMADAQLLRTTATLSSPNMKETFIAQGEVVTFDGFLKLYLESTDEENTEGQDSMLPALKEGEEVVKKTIVAQERFSQRPSRYTEASLVRKLEELGIGRPSTYAPIISTIQMRGYVERGEMEGEERNYNMLTLSGIGDIKDEIKKETTGAEKGKLLPTDTGIVVTNFLDKAFPKVMDYNFTARVEKEFDEIAEGKAVWGKTIDKFYKGFHPEVEAAMQRSEHKVGERILGTDPKSGKPISVKIGRFGPVVQIGTAEDEEKPQFASLRRGQSIETITLEEALDLFKLPRVLGEYEGATVSVAIGRFGPYVRIDNQFVSLPKTENPLQVSLETAISLIEKKREEDRKKELKSFDEDPDLKVLNGRYGPYISYKKQNYKIPKKQDPMALTREDCLALIASEEEKGRSTRKSAIRNKKS
jgi:DNA topoisomerase-1